MVAGVGTQQRTSRWELVFDSGGSRSSKTSRNQEIQEDSVKGPRWRSHWHILCRFVSKVLGNKPVGVGCVKVLGCLRVVGRLKMFSGCPR